MGSTSPHTVSVFELPIENLKKIQNGKTYYVWLKFISAGGNEIIHKAVELIPRLKQEQQISPTKKIAVTHADIVSITANNVLYSFNPTTGHLVSASLDGNKLIADLKPTIWHNPDRGESSIIGSKIAGKLPNLNLYTTHVTN